MMDGLERCAVPYHMGTGYPLVRYFHENRRNASFNLMAQYTLASKASWCTVVPGVEQPCAGCVDFPANDADAQAKAEGLLKISTA